MKSYFLSIVLLLHGVVMLAQECNCPPNELGANGQPVRIFPFSNKKEIGLCGYLEKNKKDTIYSEFILYQCGQSKILEEWVAKESCKIKQVNDTLFVEDLYGLPLGKQFKTIWVPFYVHKFFFDNLELVEVAHYRKDLKKYNDEQIARVIAAYKKLTKGNWEHTIDVANMLFWGYVSESKQCEVYLNTLKAKFGPFDGAIAEEWDDIYATYEHWKEENKKSQH